MYSNKRNSYERRWNFINLHPKPSKGQLDSLTREQLPNRISLNAEITIRNLRNKTRRAYP